MKEVVNVHQLSIKNVNIFCHQNKLSLIERRNKKIVEMIKIVESGTVKIREAVDFPPHFKYASCNEKTNSLLQYVSPKS